MVRLQGVAQVMSEWRKKHEEIISSFMEYISDYTDDFILKGGTALLLCYGLDRFSEDIDLDGTKKGLIDIVDKYCFENDYSYRVGKDTEIVERCFINYGDNSHPLKVEASYRNKDISDKEVVIINNIKTYSIDVLCDMKATAYSGRDKIRDVYDLSFICNNYYDKLSPQTIRTVKNVVGYKGIEHFDYIIRSQPDELIDTEKLVDSFLSTFDRLGLLIDVNEKEILEKYEKT